MRLAFMVRFSSTLMSLSRTTVWNLGTLEFRSRDFVASLIEI